MFLERLLASSIVIVICLAPLPLGSNRDWSWSPLAALVAVLLILTLSLPRYPPIQLLWPSLLLATAVLLWILFQACAPVFGTWQNPIFASIRDPALRKEAHIAVDREAALTGLMLLLTYVSAFLVAAGTCRSRRLARACYTALVASAVVYTAYAIVAGAIDRTTIATGLYFYVPTPGQFSGPFVNRNNYATYAALAAVVAIVMAIGTLRSRSGFSDGREPATMRWRRLLARATGPAGFWLWAALVLIVGVLLSGSRGGGIAILGGATSAVAVLLPGRYRWRVVPGALIFLTSLLLLVPGGSLMVERAISSTDSNEARQELAVLTLHAIYPRWALGWGSNSFSSLYGVLQPIDIDVWFDKAHNTYLELALDLGIPAASALLASVGLIIARCARGLRERRKDQELCAAGLCATVVVGLHSMVDFGLQIPGIAILYAFVLGTAWAQSWPTKRSS
jgi:O-antigen ligase